LARGNPSVESMVKAAAFFGLPTNLTSWPRTKYSDFGGRANLPMPSGAFDLILSQDALNSAEKLPHPPDLVHIAEEVARILRPGGFAVLHVLHSVDQAQAAAIGRNLNLSRHIFDELSSSNLAASGLLGPGLPQPHHHRADEGATTTPQPPLPRGSSKHTHSPIGFASVHFMEKTCVELYVYEAGGDVQLLLHRHVCSWRGDDNEDKSMCDSPSWWSEVTLEAGSAWRRRGYDYRKHYEQVLQQLVTSLRESRCALAQAATNHKKNGS
jgi:hypothetical protein